jgi:hypothetical protein
MLRGFSHAERQAFLRFAWGQSRLPYNPKDFTQKMRVMTCQYNDDQHLPVTHTCFFQVELPKYSSREVRWVLTLDTRVMSFLSATSLACRS